MESFCAFVLFAKVFICKIIDPVSIEVFYLVELFYIRCIFIHYFIISEKNDRFV